ncbi:MAG: NTP transferase domain-containing protein [Sphingobacteriales bacterium]|nr:NTP transferase domain-containing protein [Sphingobacteriales bacterium]
MNIIIPMAGRGTRLRPHTLTTAKPLIPIAGKPMVQRLVEDLESMAGEKIDNIGFVIGDFGEQVEKDLLALATSLGATGHIYHQHKPLGTAHAILCAAPLLQGRTIVAFADTLFRASFHFNLADEGCIIVQRVDDPRAYGVVKLNEAGFISDFVEKPDTFVSDMAIIGIYYFSDGDYLRREMQYLLDNDIKDKGEFQLTNALENMKQKGTRFTVGSVEEWLDCGNKDACIYTNERVLEHKKESIVQGRNFMSENSVIIEPCFIGEGVILKNSVVGPYVSIGNHCSIHHSVVSHSIIQHKSNIIGKHINNSMIGSNVTLKSKAEEWSIGDFSFCHDE